MHAHHSPEERARVLDALRFPDTFPNLNATWDRLKARLPRLCAHVGSIQVDPSRESLACIALVNDAPEVPDAATFSFVPHQFLRRARELGLDLGGPHARLIVHPALDAVSEWDRTAILCHELAHVQQILTVPNFSLVYALESSAVTYFENRFERWARIIGAKRGIAEMCGLPSRMAAAIAKAHCDRQTAERVAAVPSYDELAREIRKLTRKGRGRRGARR